MAKLEQKARKGLYGGFKPGSTGGPGTGKFKNTVKRISNNLKRKAGDVVSNVKDKIETRKTEKATEELAVTGSSKNPRFLQDALNPVQNSAMTAGGSRPMTAMNNPQIDPITGMPITAGGQPNMNPNFIGGMANSNIPTTGMLAQEKKMTRTMKPLPPAVPDKSDSTAMFMGGNAPGQYANPIWTPAADSAKVRFPNIEANKIKSSDIFKKGDQLHDITRHIPIVNKRYGTEEASKKAFDEATIDQQRYKIGQENKERKSMRVKKK